LFLGGSKKKGKGRKGKAGDTALLVRKGKKKDTPSTPLARCKGVDRVLEKEKRVLLIQK